MIKRCFLHSGNDQKSGKLSSGMGGRFNPESVATLFRNGWQVWTGICNTSIDLISSADQYKKVINFPYYFKSIVDNGLTPGFNIFNAVRVAHALKYIYTHSANDPTYKDINNAYHADMLTIYGEFFILFGLVISLAILFVFSYIFKFIYLSVSSKDKVSFHVYKSAILFFFVSCLNSFGIDWMVFGLIGMFLTIFLFKNFFRNKKVIHPIPGKLSIIHE